MAALVRNRTPRQAAHISPAQSHHPPLHTPAAPAPAASALASPPTVSPPLPTRLGSPHTLPATSSTAVKRRAASPAPRPSPKRSRSQEEADDSFLALLLPHDMSRFSLPSQPVDAWAPPHRDDDRVTLPPIAEDRRASLPVASSSGYVFTNTFESPRPGTAASSPGQPLVNRRPQMHNRTFSSPVLPAHTMQVRGNAIGLQDDPLAFSPHGIPPGAIDWLGPNMQSRPVSRDDGSMSEFDPTFGLDSGANSPAFAFGPGPSPFSGFSPQFHPRSQQPLNIAQALASSAGPSPMNSPAPGMPIDPALGSMPTPSRDQLEGELSAVRAKIRELEFLNDLLQLRVVELESDKNKAPDAAKKPTSPEFEASWEARTEARIKRFCSLNRAGNALCAWHDSRRERRSYPPRMAPPGYLNCGCTFEEALFEESLARHAVGSYHPGESVRMDPALRNPLLKLLQWRFGYKDGDFERDPASGEWVDGEGEQAWEPTRTAGSSSSRRHRSND